MSNSSKSAPATFALDYHTKQFFDPSEWEGAIEATFFLDSDGLRGREFQGRIALLCSSDPIIVIREIGGDGEVLLKRTPYSVQLDESEPPLRANHWAQWLGLIKDPRLTGCPLPILPNLSANFGLSRLHFDSASGFGAQVCSQGHAYLFDLRDVESAEKRHHPFVEMTDLLGKDGMRTLFEMGAKEFHAALEAMFRDESGSLFQVLRFYRQSDDERAMEVFGCTYQALKRALEALKLALTVALGPGGEFEGSLRAGWHPWHQNLSEAVSLNLQAQWWEDIAAPAKLADLMERVCAATGCHLRLEREADDAKEKGARNARMVAQEWANEFRVWAESANGHAAMEAGVELREMLNQ